MRGDLSIYTAGARLERMLRTLPPGKALDIHVHDLRDIVVPANPLDRQTPEYLVECFKSRLPFYCEVQADTPLHPSKFTFYRPERDDAARR